MADYSRPASGFDFTFLGQNSTLVADKLPTHKYAIAQNIRAYSDRSIRNRPGLQEITNPFTFNPVTALRAYATLNTDNQPRYLFKSNVSLSSASVFLDTGAAVDTGYAPGLGASLIPYRPNQSPQSYMYIGDAKQYRKLSAPDSGNTVIAQKVGIVEPQIPVDAGMSAQNYSYVAAPAPSAAYIPSGTAGPIIAGSRVADTVQGVFPDPTGCGITTLQISGGGTTLPPGVYKEGPVTAYFFSTGDTSGVVEKVFPVDPATATATATGNSFEFNGPSFRVPPFMPMLWGILTGPALTGSFVPWSGANQNYVMGVLGNLYIPTAGTYTITINHDDGMFFAIQGATLVSGPVNDPVGHTKTMIAGYSFNSGGIAGSNIHGVRGETFSINFPRAGVYPIEVDYGQNDVFQTLEVLANTSDLIIDAGGTAGYQRYMALEIDSQANPVTVQDVFPPLPTALGIESIYYYSGTTGRCVITPASLSPVPGNSGQSLYEQNLLSGLRRGALVQIGAEVCLVLNVTNGPTGNICFETVTQSNHTAVEGLIGVSAISIFGTANLGDSINSADITFSIGTGIGAIQTEIISNPFVSNNFSFQSQDYIHFSMNVDNLAGLNEMKILFDVGDGTFTRNFYTYSVRQNDIVAGISNQLTQLGVAQLVSQRATIDEENAAESGNQGTTSSSAQSTTGSAQWSEILFPISALERVGNDQTKSLQNVNAVQVLFNASSAINVQFNSMSVLGGFAPDVGQIGAPYQYIIRARSSITGAVSNPSPPMRYGVTTRRGQVSVYVPISYPTDPQADTWDVFRFGGALTAYTYIGSVPIGSTNAFLDTYGDDAVISSQQADYENFEPWPTIDLPFNQTASQVNGTTAVVTITDATLMSNVMRYLPGNLVQIGQQVYTLWTRPTQIPATSTFLFQFLENAGSFTNQVIKIYEPAMANQVLPYLWGPTEEGGNIFGCGDSLRPGYVYFSKNFNPDAAPDNYNLEVSPPSEPLLGGEVLNGYSYVASTDRWWQLRPSFGGQSQYTSVEAPVGRGLAAPFGHCTDGSKIYFVAKDGIYVTAGGPGVSLTDADRYNLFPHDGVAGQNYTYNGVTIFAPDYGRAQTFRLSYNNNYLFFDYQDSAGAARTMVYDIRHQGWSDDVYLGGLGATIHYSIEQQEGSLNTSDQYYGLQIVGGADGKLYKVVDGQGDNNLNPIACIIATKEFTAEDERSQKLFGDFFLDYLNPNPNVIDTLTVTPVSLGAPISPATALAFNTARQQSPIDFVTPPGLYSFSVGLFFTWFVRSNVPPTVLYTWQPSYINKPEITTGRAQDWDNAGDEGAKWVQGFILEAIAPATKQIGVRNGDNQILQQTFAVNHPIQQEKAYSFTQPFVAHMMRIEPQDTVPWNFFNVKWVYQRTPEQVTTWWTQASSCGWRGYGHVYSAEVSYASQAPVNFLMTFDGTTQTYILPSTGGVLTKAFLNLMANKGKLYSFQFQSTAGFSDLQIWEESFVLQVGAWDRREAYAYHVSVGGKVGTLAEI